MILNLRLFRSESSSLSNGGNGRDVLQDFWQAAVDLHSHLSCAQANRQHDVTVSTDTMRTLFDNVEASKMMQCMQEKRSIASLYLGTLLGALIGIISDFFVSFLLMQQNTWNIMGVAISFALLVLVCVTLFLPTKKYAEWQLTPRCFFFLLRE
jgi:uncharacterized membrane protein (UPF0136 family)